MPVSAAERISQWDDFAEPYARLAQGCLANMLDALAALAKNRPAIELGAGAGRVRIPLSRRGVPVPAVEFSPQMIRHLREAAVREGAKLEILPCDCSNPSANKQYGLACYRQRIFCALLGGRTDSMLPLCRESSG